MDPVGTLEQSWDSFLSSSSLMLNQCKYKKTNEYIYIYFAFAAEGVARICDLGSCADDTAQLFPMEQPRQEAAAR